MEESLDNSLKPIILKTSEGFAYFDYNEVLMFKADKHITHLYTVGNYPTISKPLKILYSLSYIEKKYCNRMLYKCHRSVIINLKYIEKLEVKTHKLFLKDGIVVHVSEDCLRFLKQMSDGQDLNIKEKEIKDNTDKISVKKRIRFIPKFLKRKIIKWLGKGIIDRILIFCFITQFILILCSCEGKNIFLRPDLPEKLCCIAVIDADDTTNFSRSVLHYYDLRNSIRYISLEKSRQSEYPKELNDSLQDLTFCISSSEKEIINLRSTGNRKNLFYMEVADSINFSTGERYFLDAKEKSTEGISSEVIVPEPPPKLNLISVERNTYKRNNDFKCGLQFWGDYYYSEEVRVSFKNNNTKRQYYAFLIDAKGALAPVIPSVPYHGPVDFIIKECNASGFISDIQGINMIHYYCNGIDPMGLIEKELAYAFFIDSEHIMGDECSLIFSIPFRDAHSPLSTISTMRIKLLTITEEFYLFEKSLQVYKKVKNDPFSEPVYMNGNITGGNGIFTICRSTCIEVCP